MLNTVDAAQAWPSWWARYRSEHVDLSTSTTDEPRTIKDLLADDARILRRHHRALVDAGTPGKAAAKYLAGWYGGMLAGAVTLALARTGVSPVVDKEVTWLVTQGGWPRDLDLAEPAWSEQPQDAVEAISTLLRPLIEACSTLNRVGPAALWAEVADGVAAALAGNSWLVNDRGSTALLTAADAILESRSAPWRRRPTMWAVDAERLIVARKGGCCLAYTTPPVQNCHLDDVSDDLCATSAQVDRHESATSALTPVEAYLRRFPVEDPAYCGNCLFRDPGDITERVRFWALVRDAERSARTICAQPEPSG